MSALIHITIRDQELLSRVSEAMAESARRSGDWLVCRPGCYECCLGPFAITRLDALRLRQGLTALEATDPARAKQVRMRAAAYVAALPALHRSDIQSVEDLPPSLDDVPCPALDPASGCCDLYAARPMTCRTFGPVTRTADGALAACELCYAGATVDQMAQCAVDPDPEGLEGELLGALEGREAGGVMIVALALFGEDMTQGE